MESRPQKGPSTGDGTSAATSELNNLLEIISGTSAAIENIWDGNDGSQKYFDMLRTSVDRAAKVTAQLVEHAGGSDKKSYSIRSWPRSPGRRMPHRRRLQKNGLFSWSTMSRWRSFSPNAFFRRRASKS